MGKDIRIAVRVTVREKEKIQAKARKCGLSTTEYVKQRALEYEPRAVPPDALFACLEKLGELALETEGEDGEILSAFADVRAVRTKEEDFVKLSDALIKWSAGVIRRS